jgi:tetratricopeptide (TPR) repeat protein
VLEARADAARAGRRDAAAQSAHGHALLRAGRYREATRAFQAAARLQRRSPQALYDVARVPFAQGDYRAAQRACRPIEQIERDATIARVCRARSFLVWNRAARAFEELEAALGQSPNDFEALLALGDAHRLRMDVAQAEQAYRRAAQANASSAEPHLGLGRLFAAASRRDDAVRALRRAIELDAESPEIQYELGRLLGGSAEARTLLQRAAAGRPTWAEAQVALGDALLAAGDHAGSRAAFERAIELNGQLADAHAGLGRALMALGEHDAAEAALRRSLEIVSNSPATVLALASLYEETDRAERAFEQYRHAADLDPTSGAALVRAAGLALRLDRDVLAAGFLDRVLAQHPNDAAALAVYGDVMVKRRNPRAARDYYTRALRAGGDIDRARIEQALRRLPQARQRPRPQQGRRR